METNNVFGQNLTTLRKKVRLTRRELAEKLGINENTLTGYERDGHEPKYSILAKIADFFGVSTDALIRDENSANTSTPPDVVITQFSINVDKQQYSDTILSFEDSLKMSDVSKSFIEKTSAMFQIAKETLNVNLYEPTHSTEIKLSCEVDSATLSLIFKIDKNNTDFSNHSKEAFVNGNSLIK